MRKTLIVAAVAASLGLGGCATIDRTFGTHLSLISSTLTTTVQNPVGPAQLAEVENAYGIALSAAIAYRKLPLCSAIVQLPCSNRTVVLELQSLDRTVQAALRAARTFVRNNQTVNAASALQALEVAITDFQSVAQQNGVI